MRVEDLRIGNLFYVEKDSCLFNKGINKVSLNTFNDIHLKNAITSMRPIELTEEILLKCGFYKDIVLTFDLNNEENKTTLQYEFATKKIHICRKHLSAFSLKVECLHQLQNIFFALTNEELTINL